MTIQKLTYTLAIETATSVCSAALMADDKLLGEKSALTNQRHNETLPTMVADLLADAELKPRQIDLICVSNGPGSFSGLRVGLSYAKGFAEGANSALVPVPTLDALALRLKSAAEKANINPMDKVIPLVIARKGEVFGEVYAVNDGELASVHETFIANAEVLGELTQAGSIVGGTGLETLNLDDEFVTKTSVNIIDGVRTSAEQVGLLGRAKWLATPERFEDFASLEPRYIQEFTVRVGKGF